MTRNLKVIAYSVKEAAEVCGLGRSTLYRHIEAGLLKSVKRCGRRLILHDDLMEFLTGRGV